MAIRNVLSIATLRGSSVFPRYSADTLLCYWVALCPFLLVFTGNVRYFRLCWSRVIRSINV